MTVSEFDAMAWSNGVKARYHVDGNEHVVIALDFVEKLVGLDGGDGEIRWVRCENVTVVIAD